MKTHDLTNENVVAQLMHNNEIMEALVSELRDMNALLLGKSMKENADETK